MQFHLGVYYKFIRSIRSKDSNFYFYFHMDRISIKRAKRIRIRETWVIQASSGILGIPCHNLGGFQYLKFEKYKQLLR